MSTSNANREIRAELAVGTVVALLFLGLAFFTIVISGKSFFTNNVFEIEAVLPDAMGLRRNDPVIAKGTTVGTVTEVYFAEDGVHVSAKLEAPVVFYEDYTIRVVATSILGGRQLVLHEGDPAKPRVEDVHTLQGVKSNDLMDDLSGAVSSLRDFLDGPALDDLTSFSENLKNVGNRIENGEGTLGKLLSSDDEVYTNLNATVANLKAITDRLEAGEGTLGKLLSSDDEVYTNLNATVANLKAISDRLEAGEGTLGKLLSSDEEVYNNLNGAITDVREIMDDLREANTLSTFTSVLLSGF